MATKNLVPRATGEGGLGTSTYRWGNIYAVDGNFSDDVTITDDLSVGGELAVTGAGTFSTGVTVSGTLTATIFHERSDPTDWDYTVTSFTADGDFHDLDLSSIVTDSDAKAVLLRVRARSDTASKQVYFRKNGNSNTAAAWGLTTQVGGVVIEGVGIVPCSTSQVIEYVVSSTGTWSVIDVVVMGWFF